MRTRLVLPAGTCQETTLDAETTAPVGEFERVQLLLIGSPDEYDIAIRVLSEQAGITCRREGFTRAAAYVQRTEYEFLEQGVPALLGILYGWV